MSNAVTTAPSRRAVAIACSPATPAPSTSTCAGGIVPAAVISIGKKRGDLRRRRSAPRGSRRPSPARTARPSTARARCAGSSPSPSAVAPVRGDRLDARRRSLERVRGSRPGSCPSPSLRGLGLGRRRDLGDHLGAPRVAERRRPASVKASSGSAGRRARAGLDHDLVPGRVSRRTTSGTSATRRSPSAVSLGTPILMGAGTVPERGRGAGDRCERAAPVSQPRRAAAWSAGARPPAWRAEA